MRRGQRLPRLKEGCTASTRMRSASSERDLCLSLCHPALRYSAWELLLLQKCHYSGLPGAPAVPWLLSDHPRGPPSTQEPRAWAGALHVLAMFYNKKMKRCAVGVSPEPLFFFTSLALRPWPHPLLSTLSEATDNPRRDCVHVKGKRERRALRQG